ncbi:MAG: hypothetical protein ACFB9M_14300 [Myxococcota bacterium]
MTIDGALLSNGILGLENAHPSTGPDSSRHIRLGEPACLDFGRPDLILVPNGTAHVAMLEGRNRAHDVCLGTPGSSGGRVRESP